MVPQVHFDLRALASRDLKGGVLESRSKLSPSPGPRDLTGRCGPEEALQPYTHLKEACCCGLVILGQQQVIHEHPEEGLLAAQPGPCVLQQPVELEHVPACRAVGPDQVDQRPGHEGRAEGREGRGKGAGQGASSSPSQCCPVRSNEPLGPRVYCDRATDPSLTGEAWCSAGTTAVTMKTYREGTTAGWPCGQWSLLDKAPEEQATGTAQSRSCWGWRESREGQEEAFGGDGTFTLCHGDECVGVHLSHNSQTEHTKRAICPTQVAASGGR